MGKSKQKYMEYKKAVEFVNKLNLKNWKDWVSYCKNKTELIPSNPSRVYSEWNGWNEWLGNTNKQYGKKYSVNENFFKTWSKDMAYIFGLWFADGCITGKYLNVFSISLHKNDSYLLELIKSQMSSNHKVYCHQNMSSLVITNKEIVKDIINLGGIPRKSLVAKFPYVPDEFLPDFIRGLWDGDGTIGFNKKTNRYYSSICSGSKDFINSLYDILRNKAGIDGGSLVNQKTKIGDKIYDKTIVLSLSVEDTRRLAKYMYKNDGMALARKKDKFMDCGKAKSYLCFKEALYVVKLMNIKSKTDWFNTNCPENLPRCPYLYYDEWQGWRHWLGK